MSKSDYPTLPKTGFVRLAQIIGDTKANPPIPAFIPIGRSTWRHWVKIGKAPAPAKLGPKTTAWRAEEILAFVERLAKGSFDPEKPSSRCCLNSPHQFRQQREPTSRSRGASAKTTIQVHASQSGSARRRASCPPHQDSISMAPLPQIDCGLPARDLFEVLIS